MDKVKIFSTTKDSAATIINNSKLPEEFRNSVEYLAQIMWDETSIIAYENKQKISALTLCQYNKKAAKELCVALMEEAIDPSIRGSLSVFEVGDLLDITNNLALMKALTMPAVVLNGEKEIFPPNRWLFTIDTQNVRFEKSRGWQELKKINVVTEIKPCLTTRVQFRRNNLFKTLPTWEAVLKEVEAQSRNFVANLMENKSIYEGGAAAFPTFMAQEIGKAWSPTFISPKRFSTEAGIAYEVSDEPTSYNVDINNLAIPENHLHWAGWR